MEKIQKINILYLLGYIFIPAIICALGYTLCYFCFRDGGTGAVLTTMVPTIAAVVWWIFGGSLIFKQKTKELEKRFEAEGYRRNQTFYGRGQTVVLDVEKGMMGVIFYWNPFQNYILPASRISRAWTDDGRGGAGFMEGSSRVSFIFTIDQKIDVRVNTFMSNQRWRMDDKRILTGISKADLMVKNIEEAKKNSLAKGNSAEKSAKSDKTSDAAKTDKKSDKSSK
jgi:hypothetical protein